jgi:hypothetical protein
MMQTRASILFLICFLLSLVATPAVAVEFAIVGPRASGMGGAGVAVTTDAYATYWNPAGLAMVKSMDIRIQGTAQVTDRLGIASALNDLKNFDPTDTSTANQDKAKSIASQINRAGATVSGVGTAGLYFKGHFGEHAFGFNVSDVATSGGFVSTQLTVSGTNIIGQMALRGLEARQAAFSYAYAFADKTFAIGVTGKIIQGAAYNNTTNLQGGQDPNLLDNFGKAKISTSYGIDVGAMYRPSSWLRFGVVAKDINQPSFDAPIQADSSSTRRCGGEPLVDHDHYRGYGYYVQSDARSRSKESGVEPRYGADDYVGVRLLTGWDIQECAGCGIYFYADGRNRDPNIFLPLGSCQRLRL